jgi:hypothetical protein
MSTLIRTMVLLAAVAAPLVGHGSLGVTGFSVNSPRRAQCYRRKKDRMVNVAEKPLMVRKSASIEAKSIDASTEATKSLPFATKSLKSQEKKRRYIMMKHVADAIRNKDPRAVAQAEQLLERCQPATTQMYNLYLHALAEADPQLHPMAPQQAEHVVRNRMPLEQIKPDMISYTNVLNAYARHVAAARASGEEFDALSQRAERFLFDMLQQQWAVAAPASSSTNPAPSTATIDCFLNLLAQQGSVKAATHAHQILQQLEELCGTSTNQALARYRPTAHR